MSRSLRVPGSRLRLRTPRDSGGSLGIKLAVFPYIVLMSVASKIAGRPVRWIEDRYEHLIAANSCPNRVTTLEAAGLLPAARCLPRLLFARLLYPACNRRPSPGRAGVPR